MNKLLEYIYVAPVSSLIFIFTIVTSVYVLNYDWNIFDKFKFNPRLIIQKREYYRLLTSGLIHVNYPHLFVNMVSFIFCAFLLEEKFIKPANLAIIYLGSILGGNIPDLIVERNNQNYNAAGASGGISGILFCLSAYAIAFMPGAKFLMMGIIPIPAWSYPFIFITFSVFVESRMANVGYRAHIGGAITGLILTLILDPGLILYIIDAFRNIFGSGI